MVESESLLIKVEPSKVIFFDKIIESIDNLAIVTVIDGKKGLIEIKTTSSLKNELLYVLKNIGKKNELIIEQERTW